MLNGGLDGLGRRTGRHGRSHRKGPRMRWVCLGRRADLMLGSLGHSSDLAPGWMLRFGSVARFKVRFGPTLPPFHPPTPWRTVSLADRHGPAVLRCCSGRVPLTLHSSLAAHSHSHLSLPNSPASIVDDLTNLVHFQPRISRFALAWPSTPLPLRSRFEFLFSSSITCPPNSPALSCFSALAGQPLHRYASSTCIRLPRRRLSGSRASPCAASSISPRIIKPQ